jgi:hypothetical protein
MGSSTGVHDRVRVIDPGDVRVVAAPAQIVTSFVMRGERDPPHAQDI